jgi:hypothetical protein
MSTYKKRCFLQVVAITVVAGFLNGSTSSAKVLFLAHYNDATADADYALGSPTASGAGGYPVAGTTGPGEGKWGRGLDQRTNGDGRCAYDATGNLDPLKGTADFWFILDDYYPGVTVQPVFGWFNPPHPSGVASAFYVHVSGISQWFALTLLEPDPTIPAVSHEQAFVPAVGQWYHLEINWDCTGGDGASTYNVYMDGQPLVRRTDWNALGPPGGEIRVGIWGFLEGFFLHGRIDELRITDQVEHLADFAPPTEEYGIPGTAGGVADTFDRLQRVMSELGQEIDDLTRALEITGWNAGNNHAVAVHCSSALAAQESLAALQSVGGQLRQSYAADNGLQQTLMGNLIVTAASIHDPDCDNDGTTDANEAIAGTDPLDPDSFFHIVDANHTTGQAILTWPSVFGRLYTVWCATNLLDADPWQVVQSNIVSTPPANVYTNNPPSIDPRFYQIGVE